MQVGRLDHGVWTLERDCDKKPLSAKAFPLEQSIFTGTTALIFGESLV